MKKDFKTLLGAAAILGSMSATIVYALDIDTPDEPPISASTTFNEAVNVTRNGILTIDNEVTVTINDKLTNNHTINNNGNIVANEILNASSIKHTDNVGISSITINNGGENQGILTQDKITLAGGTFKNSGSISASQLFEIASGAKFENSQKVLTSKNFINNGTTTNNSIINTNENLNNSSIINGTGAINISNGNNSGSIIQNNIIISGDIENTNEITSNNNFTNNGNITGDSGKLTVTNGTNSGNITQSKLTISTNTGFENATGGVISAEIENNGKFTNNGLIGSAVSNKDFANNGTFINNGDVFVKDLKNSSKIENNKNIISSGKFTNTSEVTGNAGNLTVVDGTNSGNITQSKLTISNNTGFENAIGGVISAEIENNGKFTNAGTIGSANSAKDFTNNGSFTNTGDVFVNKLTNNTNSTLDGAGNLMIASGLNSGSIAQNILTITGNAGFQNNGSIIAKIANNGTFTNAGAIGSAISAKDFTNSGTFTNNSDVFVNDLSNSGIIHNTSNIIVSGNLENTNLVENSGKLDVTGKLTNIKTIRNLAQGNINVSDEFINSDNFSNAGTVNANKVTNKGKIANSGTFEASTITNGDANSTSSAIVNTGNLTVSEMINNAILKNKGNNSQLDITTSLTNNGSILNEGAMNFAANSVLVNTDTISVENGGSIVGAIVKNTKVISAKDASKLDFVSLDNAQGTISLKNGSRLNITNQTSAIEGTIIAEGNNNSSQNRIDVAGSNKDFIGTLLVGNNAGDKTDLTLGGINVTNDAQVGIAQAGKLILSGNSTVNLNEGDTVKGDIELLTGGKLNFDGYNLVTGDKSTQSGGNKAYYSQSGGSLNLLNNSTLALGDSAAMTGGDLNIDGTSQFLVASEANGTIDSANFLDNLTMTDGARFGVMNSDGADYNIENINVNNGTANFTIDVLGRSNAEYEHGSDQFFGGNINGNGTINIEDWTLAGDIFGWQAPIDRDIKLDNVFAYNNISPNVKLTATKKEVFTPIGWYQLNNHGGMNGNYQLNLTRFNPQVYRGQVTTLSQYMNQLAIDDMLFNHSMLLPSFKDDDLSDNGIMANRYAAANPLYAPYQYSKKDGGLWYRMYGTFETLQMNQAGLGRVGNNAYGTIIGADFGLKELKHGWKFMPTAYIGYNGAHQYFAGAGAYQNGGQAGFLGTWYKDNFVLGGLVYGGVYQNSMDIAGHTDNTFNYFAGASAKGAYNWRFHRDWVLQPNLMLAYNFFGQQNWHSDFGQMGMMSGILNGINLAPGMNLIWEKETFSIYATLQYMYNLNGAVDGRAGNVSLPHLYMDRGYIQYGFGFTKRFTDIFSGYFQTVFRNVGRTGVGFQLGLNIKLGK